MEFVMNIILSSVRMATPLIFLALAELYSQRAGLVHIGLEGLASIGSLVGFLVSLITGSPMLGVAAGAAVGILVNLVFAYATVTLCAEQIVSAHDGDTLGSGHQFAQLDSLLIHIHNYILLPKVGLHNQIIDMPPLTLMVAPVIKSLSLLARNKAAPATSLALPKRCRGTLREASAEPSVSVIAVRIVPGAMQLQVMLYSPTCLATAFAQQITPALETG